MKKHLGYWLTALIAGLFLLGPAAAQPVAGRDYKLIEPAQPTDDPARIEAIEFFSYACPHCYELDPLIRQWSAKLPRDVIFKRVPVGFNNPYYQLMAKLFYTLDTTGDRERVDAALFEAIHEKGARLVDEKSITAWAVSQGVDARRFSEAWSSFSTDAKMKRADQMSRAYRIEGVPAVVVDGLAHDPVEPLSELPEAINRVIELRRGERKK